MRRSGVLRILTTVGLIWIFGVLVFMVKPRQTRSGGSSSDLVDPGGQPAHESEFDLQVKSGWHCRSFFHLSMSYYACKQVNGIMQRYQVHCPMYDLSVFILPTACHEWDQLKQLHVTKVVLWTIPCIFLGENCIRITLNIIDTPFPNENGRFIHQHEIQLS